MPSHAELAVFAVAGLLGNLGPMMIAGWIFAGYPYSMPFGFLLCALACVALAWIAADLDQEPDEP